MRSLILIIIMLLLLIPTIAQDDVDANTSTEAPYIYYYSSLL